MGRSTKPHHYFVESVPRGQWVHLPKLVDGWFVARLVSLQKVWIQGHCKAKRFCVLPRLGPKIGRCLTTALFIH